MTEPSNPKSLNLRIRKKMIVYSFIIFQWIRKEMLQKVGGKSLTENSESSAEVTEIIGFMLQRSSMTQGRGGAWKITQTVPKSCLRP